jgi:hypothetical protein
VACSVAWPGAGGSGGNQELGTVLGELGGLFGGKKGS